jgi:2-C-methyl-D-erythritol 4-phosphate cytidylyltransferase / 2-C-methyl-D-erythritol 2,4-cyclodiphosphate synthase
VSVGAVVVAGGQGNRFGGLKQFEQLAGESVLRRAASGACSVASELAVVVPEAQMARAETLLVGLTPIPRVVAGGPARAMSVLAGLRALSGEPELVVIHDGVRPLASTDLFNRVLSAAREHGAAIPVLPVNETVKRVQSGRVVQTVDRSNLALVQTPQVFNRRQLLQAFASLGEKAAGCTDEAGVLEAVGLPVAVVPGEPTNLKITTPQDLDQIRGLFPARGGQSMEGLRVGFGYDVHPFAKGRKLVLGGIEFEGDGLAGHSDADIVAHAVADAVLGAAGMGDIGHHFPDSDETYRGANSLELLRRVVALVGGAGYRVGNIDLTVAARRPKIAPSSAAMSQRLADVLGIAASKVNIKATTGERLGFVGRQEGIAVSAVALLVAA